MGDGIRVENRDFEGDVFSYAILTQICILLV
jgi:hypothetical protein